MPDLNLIIRGLGRELLQAGAPIWRIRLSMRTVHPLITAVSFFWESDAAPIGERTAAHGMEGRSGYVGSPLELIARTGKPLRRRLTDLRPDDHEVFHDLASRGATDYYGMPLEFSSYGGGMLVFATGRADGFRDTDIENFGIIAAALTPIAEIHRLRRLSEAVAQAYLGKRSGGRVLGGEITRGDIETIQAAILMSDIRGWTDLNSRLPVQDTVQLANRYFDLLDDVVSSHEGEILKFMGDGVLAIFPVGKTAREACDNAMAAALAARRQASGPHDELIPDFGIGLHFGEVLYGNVGSATRLDFTVLGQAVNIAARIEARCAPLGEPILMSGRFAEAQSRQTRPVVREILKGMAEPQDLIAPGQDNRVDPSDGSGAA